jgi:hypothetical protein
VVNVVQPKSKVSVIQNCWANYAQGTRLSPFTSHQNPIPMSNLWADKLQSIAKDFRSLEVTDKQKRMEDARRRANVSNPKIMGFADALTEYSKSSCLEGFNPYASVQGVKKYKSNIKFGRKWEVMYELESI